MARALIVVDVQNDFCEGGSLPVAGGAAVAAAVNAMLEDADYEHVVATRDHHIDPGDHFSDHPDYVRSWPVHCVVDTSGSEFHPALAPAFSSGVIAEVFSKGAHAAAYSGFEGVGSSGESLADWLRQREVTKVDVVGIATDHCVRATALDAAREGFDTRVLLDLTAGVALPSTQRALEELREAGVTLDGTPVVGA